MLHYKNALNPALESMTHSFLKKLRLKNYCHSFKMMVISKCHVGFIRIVNALPHNKNFHRSKFKEYTEVNLHVAKIMDFFPLGYKTWWEKKKMFVIKLTIVR